ncbi:hypothetical protein Tco_0052500 [Tanacetum coccineum]
MPLILLQHSSSVRHHHIFISDALSDSSCETHHCHHTSPELRVLLRAHLARRHNVESKGVMIGIDVEDETSRVDVRVEVVTVARDDVETSVRDPIVVSNDGDTPPVVPEVIPEPAQEERAVEGTYETLGDLVQRVESSVTALSERIASLERNNKRPEAPSSVDIRELT